MSSRNENDLNPVVERESTMDTSPNQSDQASDSSSQPQAKSDNTDRDANNSHADVVDERSVSESTMSKDSAAAAPETRQNMMDASDADGGSVPKVPRSSEDEVGNSDSLQVKSIDNQPITQPERVDLPPIEGMTQLESRQSEDKPKDSSDVKCEAPVSEFTAGSVELPPLKKADDNAELPPIDKADVKSEASASASGAKDDNSGQSVYYIKWIHYSQNKVPIITQNENGPCPLLAIMNVLLLKGKIKLAPMIEMITSEQLMTYLGDCILDSMPENLSESVRANYEQNMQDAMSVMFKLQTGLDVNVKFTGVADFEYTPECIIFDLLSIPLYHGWLVDPQDPVCSSAVGNVSYNQLVEKIIAQKGSEKEEDVHEALVAEQFLDKTASQLTYYGLCELSTSVKEGELCVFFRNNHFSTLHRTNNELFLLVTDQGFLTESNVVWETLSNVEGDCHFVDMNFRTYTKPEPSGNIAASPIPVGSDMQIDTDYQVALSLQQETEMREQQEVAWGQYTQENSALNMADHELARRLQEEEDRRAAAAVNASQQRAAQQAQGQGRGQGGQGHSPPQAAAAAHSSRPSRGEGRHREEKKDKDCTIL